MSRKVKLIVVFIVSFSSFLSAQKADRNYFLEAEYMIGEILPNQSIDTFPNTNLQHAFTLSIGASNADTSSWGKYYNYPETGMMFVYSNLGNNAVFGYQLSALPFISLNLFNKWPGKTKLRIGAGVSYFSTFFDSITNPTNEIIGSHFTWDIKVFLSQQIFQTDKFKLKVGIGFSHESNGHTKLPNLGINSGLFSLSGQFYRKKQTNFNFPTRVKRKNHSPKSYFINSQQGYGIHEQDDSEGPLTGRSKPVYSTSFAYGVIFNNHIKLRAGLIYRFYEQFNTHLKETDIDGLSDNRTWSASNIILFVGNEFLMGHFGAEIRLGVNLHKPFYKQFSKGTDIGTKLREFFSSRVGANLYLKNTNKLPKHNLFVGAHINANMGKADFTEFTLGYSFSLKK
ncbi:MAG: acyloxyacyl hydrolase [Flavobacteriales bacterium]|nr:acyloxyacyl hydrolase [Flavobacteriales bacterium]